MASSDSNSFSLPDTDSASVDSGLSDVVAGVPWLEQVASVLFKANRKIKRLEELRARMVASVYFDQDDLQRIAQEEALVEAEVAATRETVSKQDWARVRLYLTLKHREAELEAAVTGGLIDVEADETLFSGLVKKQVYLTRLAEEQSGSE